jgi:molybdate transport system substrate-binding protein
MNRKTGVLGLLAALLSIQVCLAQKSIQIAAAADLQPVLPHLLEEYEAKTGVMIAASYASSSTLAVQISNGAPFDLFLSADMGFAQKVIDAGMGLGPKPVPYARGTLVLWERNDGPVHPLTTDALTSPSVQSVAVANPEHAPYGRAALASLQSLHLLAAVQPKLRVAENIGQAAQFAETGNAQVGLISLTSALTSRLQSEGEYVEMPRESYPPIVQGAIVVKRKDGDAKDAQAFLDWLLSEAAQAELAKLGLKPMQR